MRLIWMVDVVRFSSSRASAASAFAAFFWASFSARFWASTLRVLRPAATASVGRVSWEEGYGGMRSVGGVRWGRWEGGVVFV